MDEENEIKEELDEIKDELKDATKNRPKIKLEWIVSLLTVLGMVVSGVVSVTKVESRLATRLNTIETTRVAEAKSTARLIADYDKRIESLEGLTGDLKNELNIRREYQRHVHAHICSLLAKAHGPSSAATEKICSLPQPEFEKD